MRDTDRYYKILELEPGASPEELKQAYRGLVKVWHPDRFPDDLPLQQKAQGKLKEINEAYERLQSVRPRPRPNAPQSASRSQGLGQDETRSSGSKARPAGLHRVRRSHPAEVTSIPHETGVAPKAHELNAMAEFSINHYLGISPHHLARSRNCPLGRGRAFDRQIRLS